MLYNHDHFIDFQMKAMVGHALFWKYKTKSPKFIRYKYPSIERNSRNR